MFSKLRGRSSREIVFRLRQEVLNASMFLWAPSPGKELPGALRILPDPKAVASRLAGTPYAAEVERLADDVLAHRFHLLGLSIETGPQIDWRKDYVSGKTSEARYMRRVPYLNFEAVGDHKNIWELNRHQHLVLLAQAYLLTRKREYLTEIVAELESWLEANRFMRGVNWTSALEVAFRALSWIWIWHFVSNEMEPEFRAKLLAGLYRHGCFLERNLSIYFSPNTHLLGEAVALHALGTLFPELPRAAEWKTLGGSIVAAEMSNQVREDGSHFEQSTYYHVYTLDLFAFHLVLEPEASSEYRERLRRMADYLNALLGRSREIPYFGDDDGGRFFHPYGLQARYGRGSLAVAARLLRNPFYHDDSDEYEIAFWWLGPDTAASTGTPFSGSKIFPDAGMAVVTKGPLEVHFKYGAMGPGGAGHSHADLLSLTIRDGGTTLLNDAGTFTYIGDPQWRDWFRGTAAHNTVVIDGLNQATSAGPFRWNDKPESALESENPLTAVCRYHGFTHRRRLVWKDASTLIVVDEVTGTGEHEVAQIWHSPDPMAMITPACFKMRAGPIIWANPDTSREYGEGSQLGWMSPVYGVKQVAASLRIIRRGPLPIRLVAVFDFAGRYDAWQPEWTDA
ncbi:MAG TPA: alginate lyase family protein [Bryobacteraceae bacterium]|jgi:hypothetical protein